MKLKDALSSVLSSDELSLLVRGYDVVGDIAITIIPPELEYRERLIGETILSINKNVRVVAKRDGQYGGEYRTIKLIVIAGENNTETLHKESGALFYLNPETVYFSVRSGSERKRIADLVSEDETILVMFSGVGPYPLIIARYNPSCSIIGVEHNRVAHEYAVQNLKANRAQKQVRFYREDVREIIPKLGHDFDRIIMPLPKTAGDYLPLALGSLKQNGWLHYYDFQSPETFDHAIAAVETAGSSLRRQVINSEISICGHSGPNTYRICVDAQIA